MGQLLEVSDPHTQGLFLSTEETFLLLVPQISVEVNALLTLAKVDISVKKWFQQIVEVSENLFII